MLTLGSLRGRFGLLETAWAVPVYCGFTAANAAAGYAMAPRARKTAQMPFKVAALAQLCLTWVAFRFRPSAGPGPGINGGSALPHREAWAFTQVERSLDVVAATVRGLGMPSSPPRDGAKLHAAPDRCGMLSCLRLDLFPAA